MEEAEDSFVQFGFGGLQGLGEAGLFGAFFFEIGLPFVGDSWVFQRVGGEFEALFQGFAEGVEGEFPPGFGFLVQGIGAGFAEGLAQAALHLHLRLVTLLPECAARPGEVRNGLPLRLGCVGDGEVFYGLKY